MHKAFYPNVKYCRHNHKSDRGVVTLELQFAKILPEPVTLVTYGVFSDLIEIDADRICYSTSAVASN